jgi:hypothetical protein
LIPPIISKNKWIVGIALIAVFAMIFMSFTSLTVVGFSTETEIVQKESDFVKVKAEVAFIDEADHVYVTGWNPDNSAAKSEQIVWQGKWHFWSDGDAWFGAGCRGKQSSSNAMEYRYVVRINGVDVAVFPTTGYYALQNVIAPQNAQWYTFNLEVGSYYTAGSQFGEIEVFLDVSFQLWHDNWLNQRKVDMDHDFGKMSKDGAYLKSGAAILRLGGALPDVIEEGQNVEFYMETGNTHSTGWDCFFYPPGDKPRVAFTGNGFTGQDGFAKTCTFKIPAGWFVEGGDNEVKIELWNRLWRDAKTTFFVIDNADWMPALTNLSWATDYQAGSSVTVFMQGTPNPTTSSPIVYFRVYAYMGVPGSLPGFESEYIINAADYPATNGAAQFSFTIPDNTDGARLSVKVNVIDAAGRASLGQWESMIVGDGPAPPDVDYPFVWNVEAIIIAVIGSLACVALFIIPPFWPIAPWKIIGAIIIAILTALLCYLAGTLQLPYVTGAVIAYAEYLSATWGV